jgi:hypothetical protein
MNQFLFINIIPEAIPKRIIGFRVAFHSPGGFRRCTNFSTVSSEPFNRNEVRMAWIRSESSASVKTQHGWMANDSENSNGSFKHLRCLRISDITSEFFDSNNFTDYLMFRTVDLTEFPRPMSLDPFIVRRLDIAGEDVAGCRTLDDFAIRAGIRDAAREAG